MLVNQRLRRVTLDVAFSCTRGSSSGYPARHAREGSAARGRNHHHVCYPLFQNIVEPPGETAVGLIVMEVA